MFKKIYENLLNISNFQFINIIKDKTFNPNREF
jgi:hypothetical protein